MINVRLGVRRLKADVLHTIHVLGLTAGLVAASLAVAFVWYESTYDGYHDQADQAFYFADSTVGGILKFPLFSGSWAAFAEVGTVIITRSVARKYFGSANAVGERLTFDVGMKTDLTVVGVMEDPRPDPDAVSALASGLTGASDGRPSESRSWPVCCGGRDQG